MSVPRITSALGAAGSILLASFIVVSAHQPPQPPAGGGRGGGRGGGNATPEAPAGGQRGGGNATPAAPAAPAARAALPSTAASIAARPDAFYGQYVTIYSTVEKVLTPTSFTVDQDRTKSTGKEVIVVATRLHEKLEPNSYVTVIGEVVKPDAAEIAKRNKALAAGLPADVLAQNAGKPVIIATSVITPALSDLARFIAPPMTPEEESLDKAMKAVGAANGALRKGVDGSSVELVKTNTAILAKAFAETEVFWKARNVADAVKIAQTARAAVDAIDKAAATGNWNEAKAQNTTLGAQCAACHTPYRERLEDGTFAVKKP